MIFKSTSTFLNRFPGKNQYSFPAAYVLECLPVNSSIYYLNHMDIVLTHIPRSLFKVNDCDFQHHSSVFVSDMLLWYWQESVQKNAMKPSLWDYDTHRLWEGSQGNQSVKYSVKGVPPSFTFSHAKADCWGFELKVLVLVFVVLNFSYFLRPEYLLVIHCFQHDMLWRSEISLQGTGRLPLHMCSS